MHVDWIVEQNRIQHTIAFGFWEKLSAIEISWKKIYELMDVAVAVAVLFITYIPKANFWQILAKKIGKKSKSLLNWMLDASHTSDVRTKERKKYIDLWHFHFFTHFLPEFAKTFCLGYNMYGVRRSMFDLNLSIQRQNNRSKPQCYAINANLEIE